MKERPILFSAPMVRAILDGRKTQTRRAAKPRGNPSTLLDGSWSDEYVLDPDNRDWLMRDFPYGQPGDRLWVKETFFDTTPFRDAPLFGGRTSPIAYRADGEFIGCHKWKPSIYMPRSVSRILLEVTGVRIERLQNISEADAEAEGVDFLRQVPDADETLTARQLYECLWDGINRDGSWDANPWVWVVEFRRITA